ncbi:hypothetical protein LTS18_013818, partial [Coniosporium uncinatum]
MVPSPLRQTPERRVPAKKALYWIRYRRKPKIRADAVSMAKGGEPQKASAARKVCLQ